ncbi:MAG: hypothetical protein MAG795_00019 [Candidatus Woesearchaeota archaeon]|nr:hypothetical protein [Candidatus Woesearchaeota archaeon]
MKESEDKDIYSHKAREKMVDSDEIEPWEQGFMQGAEGLGQDAKCRRCGEVFTGKDSVVESEIKGDIMRFCSARCVKKYKARLAEE